MIKHFFHKLTWRIQVKLTVNMLLKIDLAMKRKNWPQWKRKQYWRDLIKSPEKREDLFKGTLEELRKYEKPKISCKGIAVVRKQGC